MANRRDYYFKQKVTEAELDAGFDGLETADRNLVTDANLVGIFVGLAVAQQVSPNLTVQVSGPGAAYDQTGQRVAIPSTQNADLSVDDSSVSTAVTTPGNSRIISLFIRFKRALSDLRIDGNSATVYFVRSESFEFVVNAGAEAVSPVAPALRSDSLLLADITRAYGATTIVNGNISTTRRQFAIKTSSIAVGTVLEAIAALTTASVLNYAGGSNWADGTTNPAATVEAQFDKIITDLTSVSGTRGAGKLTAPARGNWADATTNPGTTLDAALAKVITDLASAGGLNKLGPLTGTGEIVYSAARTRNVRIGLSSFQASTGVTATYQVGLGGIQADLVKIASDNGRIVYRLNPYLRDGMSITSIKVAVDPGAARAGANRMLIELDYVIADFATPANNGVDPVQVVAGSDDTTTSKQIITISGPHTVVRDGGSGRDYYLIIKGGNDAGTNNDTVYGIELTVTDPGPRNY